MSNIADRFKGMGQAEVGGMQLPSPNLGRAAFLLNQCRMKDNRKGGFRVEVSMTCLWPIEPGTAATGQEVAPNRPGDKVSVCLFSGDYFQKQFKELCLKCCGKDVSEELEIAEMLAGMDEYASMFKGKDDLGKINTMWEKVLPMIVTGYTPDGGVQEAGVFDGQVVLEVLGTEKVVRQLIDKSKGDIESNWVFDRSGNPIEKVYQNHFFVRRIDMQEVKEALGEDGIKRFFGTVDRFEQIRANQ